MKNFIVYDKQGKILRTGTCQNSTFYRQAKENEFVMEDKANDSTQKIVNVGIAGKIVDKTPEEIEEEKLPEIPFEKWPAQITNEQWQAIQDRLENLENS